MAPTTTAPIAVKKSGQLLVTPDQIVEVQNVSGGALDIHDLKAHREDGPLSLVPEQVVNLDDYDLTAAIKRRSVGLRYALDRGSLLILTIKVTDKTSGQERFVTVAQPRKKGQSKYDKDTQTSNIGDTAQEGEGDYYEQRTKILMLRERREDLETQRGKLLTEEEEAIASGEKQRLESAKLKELAKAVEGRADPANPNITVKQRVSNVVSDGVVTPVANQQPAADPAGVDGERNLDIDEQDPALARKNTSNVVPKKK